MLINTRTRNVVRESEGEGKGNKCTWNCGSTTRKSLLARGGSSIPRGTTWARGPRGSRTATDGSRRHVCGLTRPHLPPIYLCLPHRPFTRRAFIAARAARREQSTNGAPRPRVREKTPASPNKSRGDRSENPPPACPAVASYGNFVSIYDCGTWNRRADDSWMCGRIRFKCMQMRAL